MLHANIYHTSAFVVCNYTVLNENQVSIVSYTNQGTIYNRSMTHSKVILETRICNVYLTAYLKNTQYVNPTSITIENITCKIKPGCTYCAVVIGN